jgi:HPt (histidine-containing phosphotransfer) domain-containing protein
MRYEMAEIHVEFESNGSVYDPNVMAIATGGDMELSLDLLGQGFDALRSYIMSVDPDATNWPAQIHKIKGLAASLGARRLADAARIAETCADGLKREAWLGLLRRELGHLECRLFRH